MADHEFKNLGIYMEGLMKTIKVSLRLAHFKAESWVLLDIK
jgi:hypothetical protein